MIASIHRYLDKSSRKTFEYERAANFLLEFVLLAVAALPIVTGIRSAVAYGLIAALRLFETELRREDASVAGRHAERGGMLPLPAGKAAKAEKRTKTLAVVTWVWPGIAAVVQAAESKQWGLVFWISVGTTLVRVAWGRVVMPGWRRSRLAWRNAHQSEEQFATAAKEALLADSQARIDVSAIMTGMREKTAEAEQARADERAAIAEIGRIVSNVAKELDPRLCDPMGNEFVWIPVKRMRERMNTLEKVATDFVNALDEYDQDPEHALGELRYQLAKTKELEMRNVLTNPLPETKEASANG